MSYMYGICYVPFFSKNRLSKVPSSNPFPPTQKKRSDCESQKSGFGFDPKNPPWVWILWIHDPFLDLPPKNAKSVFGFGNPDLDFSKASAKFNPHIYGVEAGIWTRPHCREASTLTTAPSLASQNQKLLMLDDYWESFSSLKVKVNINFWAELFKAGLR